MCLGRTKEASEEERTFHGASEGGGEERVKKCVLGASEGAGQRVRGVSVAFDAVKRRLECVKHIGTTSCVMLMEPRLIWAVWIDPSLHGDSERAARLCETSSRPISQFQRRNQGDQALVES